MPPQLLMDVEIGAAIGYCFCSACGRLSGADMFPVCKETVSNRFPRKLSPRILNTVSRFSSGKKILRNCPVHFDKSRLVHNPTPNKILSLDSRKYQVLWYSRQVVWLSSPFQ